MKKGRKSKFPDPEEHRKYWNEYFNKYYREKVAGEYKCEHCGHVLTNPSNFRRHQRTSKKCQNMQSKLVELERAYNN